MTAKAREMVTKITTIGGSNRQWKQAVRIAYNLFGEEAIYYLNCKRFACNENDQPHALPYEEWEWGKRIHYGLQIQHSYIEEIDRKNKRFDYGREIYLLA